MLFNFLQNVSCQYDQAVYQPKKAVIMSHQSPVGRQIDT